MPSERIGLFGGTFDPAHQGHLDVTHAALRCLGLSRMWWIVSPGNPLKSHSGLVPQQERIAQARAFAHDPRIVVTGFERDLPTSYTWAMLSFLKKRHPGTRFVWVMGADCLAQFDRWARWRQIFGSLPIAVVDRPGWRLKALASPAAHAFSRYRVPEDRARTLACTPAPAWTFLTVPLSPLSSTSLRRAAGRD
jgi:nicotinate-nucleotide adenylyltransferase